MDSELFTRAAAEVEKAAAKFAKMNSPQTTQQEVSALWSEYLIHTHRAFSRLRTACAAGRSKAWSDRLIKTRHTDELLKYILHARNADEHGPKPVAVSRPTGLAIGGKQTNFDKLLPRQPGFIIGSEIAKLKPSFRPRMCLMDVRDRGVVYRVPQQHLGRHFPNATLLAKAGLKFLEASMAEARQFLDE